MREKGFEKKVVPGMGSEKQAGFGPGEKGQDAVEGSLLPPVPPLCRPHSPGPCPWFLLFLISHISSQESPSVSRLQCLCLR